MSEQEVRKLFTGQIWNARDAMKLGLIDGIASADAVLGNIASITLEARELRAAREATAASENPRGKEAEMEEGKTSVLEKVKALLFGGDADAGEGATADPKPEQVASDAISARIMALENQMLVLKAENEALKAAAEAAKTESETAKETALDGWIMRMKKDGFLLPAAEAEAKELYETLGEEKATSFLQKQGKVAPFRHGKLKTVTVTSEAGETDEVGDRMAARARQLAGAGASQTSQNNGKGDN